MGAAATAAACTHAAGCSAAAGVVYGEDRANAHLPAIDGLNIIVEVVPGAMLGRLEVITDVIKRCRLRRGSGFFDYRDGLRRDRANHRLVFLLPRAVRSAYTAGTVDTNAVRGSGIEDGINSRVVGRRFI